MVLLKSEENMEEVSIRFVKFKINSFKIKTKEVLPQFFIQ